MKSGQPHDIRGQQGEGGLFKQFLFLLINMIITPPEQRHKYPFPRKRVSALSTLPPRPPHPSVFCTCYPGNPMDRMQIRPMNEAVAPCLPSQLALMMTNTFVLWEGRWELQYVSNHCPPQISFPLRPPPPHFFFFCSFNSYLYFLFYFFVFDPIWLLHFPFLSLTGDS